MRDLACAPMASPEPARAANEPTDSVPSPLSGAEEQAAALKRRLLESTEAAARAIVRETRAEGARRIGVATRRTKAVTTAIESLDSAERRLGECIEAYGSASKALREELSEFAATLAEAERKLEGSGAPTRGGGDSKLRLVEDSAPKPSEEPVGEATADARRDEDGEDDEGDHPPPPSPRSRPAPEDVERGPERIYDDGGPEARERPTSSRMRFSGLRAFRAEDGEHTVIGRGSRQERLMAEVGGALIGLGGTIALVRFVLIG